MSNSGKDTKQIPAPEEKTPDRSSADIGIVCTHKGEVKPFLKRLDRLRSYSEKKMTTACDPRAANPRHVAVEDRGHDGA